MPQAVVRLVQVGMTEVKKRQLGGRTEWTAAWEFTASYDMACNVVLPVSGGGILFLSETVTF